jgi:ABC-2 type transport system ATP-binding protein
MRILTGFLPPTDGSAAIDGHDIFSDPLAARRAIGYLPESPPVYPEMSVEAYLVYVSKLKDVPRSQRRSAVDRALERCGLTQVRRRVIGALSKGYRQRVGLAQAIVHEPPVLILDEPTSGLDPNQIVEVRKLISRLGQEHTVILSTHYLQEVEKSCSRIIIVSQGEIVADGTQQELVGNRPAGALRARVRGPEEQVLARCAEALPGCAVKVLDRTAGTVLYQIDAGTDAAPVEQAFGRMVVQNGWDLLELVRERAHLEDVFRALTLDPAREALHA